MMRMSYFVDSCGHLGKRHDLFYKLALTINMATSIQLNVQI